MSSKNTETTKNTNGEFSISRLNPVTFVLERIPVSEFLKTAVYSEEENRKFAAYNSKNAATNTATNTATNKG